MSGGFTVDRADLELEETVDPSDDLLVNNVDDAVCEGFSDGDATRPEC
jgi:hypothetical protein